MHRHSSLVPPAALLLGLFASSCGGKVGEAVRPKDITGTQALGGGGAPACSATKLARPYVVDIEPSLRVELEAGLKRGIVVVSYNCQTLRVLPKCKVRGTYEYAGVSMKEQVVQMKNQDELNANVPLSAGKLGTELKAGNSIDLALVFVGQRTTTLDKLDHEELGGAACEGATHFISDTSLGAFAMAQSSDGKAAAAAELFGAAVSGSSSATRRAANSDGSLEACTKSDPDAPSPPAQCQSPIMLTLQPLGGTPKEAAGSEGKDKKDAKPASVIDPCPAGFALSAGKCTRAENAPRACAAKSPTCRDECAKGSAESCFNYASGTAQEAERATFYKKACDGGYLDGCGWYGRMLWEDNPKSVANKELIEIARKSCNAGSGDSCSTLGQFLWGYEQKGIYSDQAAAAKAWERGCALGDWSGCTDAAGIYRFADKVDAKRVTELYERACTGGAAGNCGPLAEWLAKEDTPGRDPERALQAAKIECANEPGQCESMARVGEALGKNEDAAKLARAGCETHPKFCDQLAEFTWKGVGIPKNPTTAKQLWKKACEAQKEIDANGKWDACVYARKGMPAKKK